MFWASLDCAQGWLLSSFCLAGANTPFSKKISTTSFFPPWCDSRELPGVPLCRLWRLFKAGAMQLGTSPGLFAKWAGKCQAAERAPYLLVVLHHSRDRAGCTIVMIGLPSLIRTPR
jgi:hypothetical protein